MCRRPVLASLALGLLLSAAAVLAGVPPPARADAPEPSRARVWRRTAGFARVAAANLRALGFASANDVAVTRRGRPVATTAPTADGDLVFLALETGSDHTAWAAYDLHARAGGAPVAAPPAPTASPGATPRTTIETTRILRDDRIHGPIAAAEPAVYDGERPTWFLARVPAGAGATFPLDPGGAVRGTPQRLEVQVFGTHAGPVAVRARWGDRDLGEATADTAAAGAVLAWTVPAEAVPSEREVLALTDASPPPPPPEPFDTTDDRGTLWVDQVTLAGPVEPRVDATLRHYPVEGGSVIALVDDRTQDLLPDPLQGSDVHAVCVGPDGLPAPLPVRIARSPATFAVPATVPPGTAIHVSRVAETAQAVPVPPVADPVAAAEGAAHLILTVPDLAEPARRLAAHRTARGLRSAVVEVNHVYETFAQGERDGDAIREYLVALQRREGNPLRFVLLVGDATLDRTDLRDAATIPARMARTKYNGATPSDRLYAVPDDADGEKPVGGPSIGRLPFRRAEDLAAYVDRVIAYETHPPAHPTRRLLRFVTGEARFNPIIDGHIERKVEGLLAEHIPPAYDLEMTYASPRSPYFWPPEELSKKVADDLSAGSLFFTYVGHGFAQGFDRVQGRSIFHLSDVDDVATVGTPPIVFVFACTTAIFDLPTADGIGEALLARPKGPLAYFGATRVCHPIANAILGQELAKRLFAEGNERTLGEILDAARDAMLVEEHPEEMLFVLFPAGKDPKRLYREASFMYVLLGDPALRPALPEDDLAVAATAGAEGVTVEVRGPFPDGTVVHVALEDAQRRGIGKPLVAVEGALPDAAAAGIRENHRRANDRALARAEARVAGGVAKATLAVPADEGARRLVKAWAVADGNVLQGVAEVKAP